jgi:hypothetical protein
LELAATDTAQVLHGPFDSRQMAGAAPL